MNKILLIRDFFPFRLISAHIKYNFFGLIYWALLFSIAAGDFGSFFGVPFLFYAPEFLGEISFMSFFLVGISVGGFIMMFHAYSYARLGPRFPFLLVVSTPFFRFLVNNSLIPLIFVFFYVIKATIFLSQEELFTSSSVALFMLGFISGILSFVIITLTYFFQIRRNKDIDDESEHHGPFISLQGKQHDKWFNYFRMETRRPIYYIGKNFKIFRSRPTSHLDTEVVEQIYAENRIYVFLFELTTLITFIGMGFFKDVQYFDIPAAMSIVTLMSTLNILMNALTTWFHRWAYFVMIIGFSIAVYLSLNTSLFQYNSYFVGLNYEEENRQEYNIESIKSGYFDSIGKNNSQSNALEILNNWKRKQPSNKPKLVIINSSGGGSRSALWTFEVLNELDNMSNDDFSNSIHLFVGASGGMIGASFYRQLVLDEKLNKIRTRHDEEFYKQISSDFLNKLSFSFSTSDIFMRVQDFEYNGKSYELERGIAFEEQFNEKTDYRLDKPIGYYSKFEKKSTIPRILFSPIIVQDGRRLLIGSNSFQDLLSIEENSNYEFVDFHQFFEKQNTQKARFTSVLRANATFPYIMPMMSLPTKPEVHLMDAGIRDNFGGKLTCLYINAYKEWIEKNTSGVVIIEIRDTKRILNDEKIERFSLLDKLIMPLSNLNVNFTRHQDYDIELLYKLLKNSLNTPVDILTFNLTLQKKDRVSLSWRLTEREKRKVKNAIKLKENQNEFKKLKSLMGL